MGAYTVIASVGAVEPEVTARIVEADSAGAAAKIVQQSLEAEFLKEGCEAEDNFELICAIEGEHFLAWKSGEIFE